MRSDTRHVHQPADEADDFESLAPPVHHASTVVFDSIEAFERRHERIYDGYSYGLYGTPTTRALERQIAALEGAPRALVTPSGQSAIALACLACAAEGDRILMPESMYGPARLMAEGLLRPLGIAITSYDPMLGGAIAPLIDERTRLVWVESPGSATFEVQDVPAIVGVAHAAGALVAADNTWATPILFNPLARGADLSVQSLSKYASGHSDLIMGSVAVRDETLFRRLKDVSRLLGLGVGADDAFLCARGLKTLPLRLRHSERGALRIVDRLLMQPSVRRILHPARPEHPGHSVWKRDFNGSAGVFSVVLRPVERAALDRAFKGLRLFKIGASWGGAHSLIAPSDPRKSRTDLAWLPDGQLIRFSIGLEDIDDLIADLERFFAELAPAADRIAIGAAGVAG
ncbi:cystathionine beta-lyase [Inquilinus sp. Marseille-Q2685]|uniref:cystathionine beta-lyase n=1 Tax=Inquilinus sp. Marseille-Q2685 TaxID=2866581 RepID=UPI001CE4AB23|nr:cystathionine beta-lyase [Inquilinus sp. Marseille-Q2685]